MMLVSMEMNLEDLEPESGIKNLHPDPGQAFLENPILIKLMSPNQIRWDSPLLDMILPVQSL